MWRVNEVLVLLCVGLWLCPQARAYFTNVDAHAEECFFDRVSSGMKMSLTFEVVEGGFLDIDVKVAVGMAAPVQERPIHTKHSLHHFLGVL